MKLTLSLPHAVNSAASGVSDRVVGQLLTEPDGLQDMTDGVTTAAIVITQADFALAHAAIVTQRESSTQRESHSLQ